MPYEINLNVQGLTDTLNAYVERQLPFATANALNRTTEEVQDRLKMEIHAKFATRTAKSGAFLGNMIKFGRKDHATKGQLATRIAVEGPEGQPGKADVLTRHIFGGTHSQPGTPLRSFFIPADASRPSRMSVVPQGVYPKALGLMDRMTPSGLQFAKRHITRSGKGQLKGKQRTFVLTGRDGRVWGVYQREGPKRSDIQLLWFYTSRVNLSARYDFYGIAERTFTERFALNFGGMLEAALRTAR